MQSYRRTATVHYSRYNFTIYSIENLSRPQPVKLDPQDLFLVYNAGFASPDSTGGFSTGSPFIAYLNTYLGLAETGQQSTSVALLSLRNLAVLPLFYFQPNYLNPALFPSPDAPAQGLPVELYTTASLTDPNSRLVVNRITLYVYTIGGALVLTLCTTIIFLGSLNPTARGIPNLSVWPVVNLPTQDDGRGGDLPQRFEECQNARGSKLLEKLRDIRIFAHTGW
jgi:hypothetical protein